MPGGNKSHTYYFNKPEPLSMYDLSLPPAGLQQCQIH